MATQTTIDNDLNQYKEDLETYYIDPDLDLATDYSLKGTILASASKYSKVTKFLEKRTSTKNSFLDLLATDFKSSNLNTINQLISSTNILSNISNLQAIYYDLVTNFADYGFINESSKFTKNAATLGKAAQIIFGLINLNNQLVNDIKSTIVPTTATVNNNSPVINTTSTNNDQQAKVKPIPESWGVKFSVSNPYYGQLTSTQQVGPQIPVGYYYMNLLPAQSSTIPIQGGRDVPNAMPGLNFKIVPNIGKHKIPGFQPAFQNLGMNQMVVTLVGSFTGADGAVNQTDTINTGTTGKFAQLGSDSLFDNSKPITTVGLSPLLTKLDQVVSNLNSYNSFQEFYNFSIRQGKQIEVEINLLKAYQGNLEAIKEFADIKLQSENGNPKFTAIVRNIDVYHRSKDRTWYTVTLEVTDFGLASKTPINLNVKLDAQIAKAQAAQKVLDTAKQNAPTVDNKLVNDALAQVGKLPVEDQKKYAALLKWCQLLIKEAKATSLYIDGSNNQPIVDQLRNAPTTTFSYSQAIPLSGDQVLLKIVINSIINSGVPNYNIPDSDQPQTIGLTNLSNPLTGGFINLFSEMTNRQEIDSNAEQISYFLFSTQDIIKEYSSYLRGPYASDTKLHGTISELNDKLNTRLNALTAPEIVASLGKAIGCTGTSLVAGAISGGVTAGIGGLVGATNIITQCIGGLGNDLYAAYINNSKETQDWKYVGDQLFSAKSITEFFESVVIQVAIDVVTRGVGGVLTGGLKGAGTAVGDGFKQGSLVKYGTPIFNKSVTLGENLSTRFINNLNPVNTPKLLESLKALDNPTNLISKNITTTDGTIVKVTNVVPTSVGDQGYYLVVNDAGESKVLNLDKVQSVPDEVFTPATIVNSAESTLNNTSTVSTSIPSANSIIKSTSVSETNQILEGISNGPNGTITPSVAAPILRNNTQLKLENRGLLNLLQDNIKDIKSFTITEGKNQLEVIGVLSTTDDLARIQLANGQIKTVKLTDITVPKLSSDLFIGTPLTNSQLNKVIANNIKGNAPASRSYGVVENYLNLTSKDPSFSLLTLKTASGKTINPTSLKIELDGNEAYYIYTTADNTNTQILAVSKLQEAIVIKAPLVPIQSSLPILKPAKTTPTSDPVAEIPATQVRQTTVTSEVETFTPVAKDPYIDSLRDFYNIATPNSKKLYAKLINEDIWGKQFSNKNPIILQLINGKNVEVTSIIKPYAAMNPLQQRYNTELALQISTTQSNGVTLTIQQPIQFSEIYDIIIPK